MPGGINSNVIQSIRNTGGKSGGRAISGNLNSVFGAEEKMDKNTLNQIFGKISGSDIKNIISKNQNNMLHSIMGAAPNVEKDKKDKKKLDEIFEKVDKRVQPAIQVVQQPRAVIDDKYKYKDMLAEIVGGKVVSDIQLVQPIVDKQQPQARSDLGGDVGGDGIGGGYGSIGSKQHELIQERKKLLKSAVEEYEHITIDNTMYIILAIVIVIVLILNLR